MNRENMEIILRKIKEYDRIMIFRHIRPDGDAVGSTRGLQAMIHLTWPEKEVLIVDGGKSDYLAFLGPEEDITVSDEWYASALGIVLDTATADRISNPKFTLCKELVKIDHHIPVESYGDYEWVEEERSSACEMVAHFYDTFRDELKINSQAATYVYTGMVTDSGRFRYREVNGNTMRCAGVMLDQGIDTETLFANLYLDEFDYLKFKAYVYNHMEITEHGVAYIHVDRTMQERFSLTREAASNVIGFLDGIRGCLCWLAFIDNLDEENSTRVRLRSRFMHINTLAERYRGGGHACASGATVYGEEEILSLLREADAMVKDYKETHEGWL